MAEKISRRKFAALALGAAALPALSRGQDNAASQPANSEVDGDMAAIDRKLSKPLSEQARKMTIDALKNNKQSLKERDKFFLPDVSEPCFTYIPSPAKRVR